MRRFLTYGLCIAPWGLADPKFDVEISLECIAIENAAWLFSRSKTYHSDALEYTSFPNVQKMKV